jgi:hypothetical protein
MFNSTMMAHPLLHSWLYRLKKLYRWRSQDWLISFMLGFSLIGMHALMFVQIVLHDHHQVLNTLSQETPFLLFQQTQTLDIANSPFQLLTYQVPAIEHLQSSFSALPDISILPAIETWFPETYVFEGYAYDLYFMDLPIHPNKMTTKWIGLHTDPPQYLTISTIGNTEDLLPMIMTKEIFIESKRELVSWFEPRQLWLSYWQWWDWLQEAFFVIDESIQNYQTWLTELSPPQYWRLYSDNPESLMVLKQTDLSTTPWTIVDIMHKQIIETTTWLPFALWLIRIFSIWLWVLYGFIWWTQFSRCQHRYQKQTRWLAQLMVSQRTIFSLLTQRLMIANYGFLASVGILLSIAVAHFQWLVNYSLISLIAFSVMLTGGLIVFSSLLQKIFPYA